MAEQSLQERTEAPSSRRRDQAREKGQVAQSSDLSQASLLVVGLGTLWLISPTLSASLRRIFRHEMLLPAFDDWTIGDTIILTQSLAGHILGLASPLILTVALCALLISGLQVGFRISFEPLGIDWSRLDWSKGWSRLFSLRSSMRGIMLVLKLSIGLGAAIWFLYSRQREIAGLGQQVLGSSIAGTWAMGLTVSLVLAGMLLVVGASDYVFQYWQHEQDLRMSRQEIRDEHKQEEGDPQIRSKMKRQQRELIKLQMLRKVPEATVVLTNPTHIAVALQYDRQTMTAPRVIAKGTDAFAKRITRIAKENGVPVLERKPLARALYASVDVNQDIPPNLYRAIAEILAHLYRIK